MPRGTLEVILMRANNLDDTFFGDIDPYVHISYRSQEHKSTVKEDAGSDPEWNESFLFTISGTASELRMKLKDKDTITSDSFIGEAKIDLERVLREGSVVESSYEVLKDGETCGEIVVSLVFTAEERDDGCCSD